MGTDNKFRKDREQRQIERQRVVNSRQPYERVLIVTEGSKTEPFYFDSLIRQYRLATANIEVSGDSDPSPDCVVNFALGKYNKFKKTNPYDKVYCVIDRDEHATFDAALMHINRINETLKNTVFFAIRSNPSFEYWYLLHYTNSNAPYVKAGGKSVGQLVEDDLKKHGIPDYTKKRKDIFQVTFPRLNIAIRNSNRIWADAIALGNMNPSTNVHELIDFLINIKNK